MASTLKNFHAYKFLSVLIFAPFFALLLALSLSAASFADSSPPEADKRFWLFGGLDFGYSHLSTSAPGESSASGTQFDVKVLCSYYLEKFTFDGGLGWLFNSLSVSNSQATGGITGINTRSPFAELDARYRFDNHWQLGPALNMTFGSDLSLTPVASNSTSIAFLGGLQADYEVNPENKDWRWRVIARVVNSMGLTNHSLFVGQVGVQMGWPFTHTPDSNPTPEPVLAAAVETPVLTSVVDQNDIKPVVQVVLGRELVHFATGSSKLSKQSHDYLKAVGKMLAQKNSAWQLLSIAGHTDNRGSHALNLKLSRNRAASVREALIEGGADELKILSKGYSFDKPLDPSNNEAAWAKNRRVEMNFIKATDPASIQQGMAEVRKKF